MEQVLLVLVLQRGQDVRYEPRSRGSLRSAHLQQLGGPDGPHVRRPFDYWAYGHDAFPRLDDQLHDCTATE